MLEPDIQDEIGSLVRMGVYSRDHLVEMVTEERYEPGELDLAEVVATIDAAIIEYEAEKTTYPAITDCDRLDAGFKGMNRRGLIALQNAGYTQSDGYDDVREAYSYHLNKESILGYCFYHGQDLERAIQGFGMYFAFGPLDPAKEQTMGLEVGRIVRDELEKAGLQVDWDGRFETRLSVPKITWQKR